VTAIAILRTTGWLYAALGGLCAAALIADAWAGVGDKGRLALGIILLVVPFGLASTLLLNSAKSRSKTDFTPTLCLLAVLYFLVNLVYGFFYWYTTASASLLIGWATLPIVWLELAVCLALGIALWSRREVIWWLGLGLGAIALYQAVASFPVIISAYPSVRYFWPDITPQVFKIVWLITFEILLIVQLLARKKYAPAG